MAKKRKKITQGDGWSLSPSEPAVQEPTSLPPDQQKLKLRTEKRKGNRVVTLIYNHQLATPERKALLKKLKQRLACGGSESPEAIEIQGDHQEAIRQWLKEQGWGLG